MGKDLNGRRRVERQEARVERQEEGGERTTMNMVDMNTAATLIAKNTANHRELQHRTNLDWYHIFIYNKNKKNGKKKCTVWTDPSASA